MVDFDQKRLVWCLSFPQQQNFAMGSLAQISSGAIRCSFNTRFRTRFRRVLVQIPREVTLRGSGGFWRRRCLVRFRRVPVQGPCEVPEGFGGEDAWWGSGGFQCRDLVRFRRVLAEKMLGEVPEGSSAETLWGSGGFWCRCFVKFQRVPMFLWHKHYFYSKNAETFKLLGIAPEFFWNVKIILQVAASIWPKPTVRQSGDENPLMVALNMF